MSINIPRFVIAAPSSGSGKSTIAIGLMAALSRDHVVQGFKVGPDYIDPGYHTAATGRVSRNLDTWMVPINEVKATFTRAVITDPPAEIAIVEGVMGLFDGYEAKTESGSTAQVAKLIDAPVILVIDVAKIARSAGAMALGYRDFDPDLKVAGVIGNNIASEKHGLWVTQSIESIGLPVLGCIPHLEALRIPERHLGLQTAIERTAEIQAFMDHAADLVTEHIDLDRIWEIAADISPYPVMDNRALDSVDILDSLPDLTPRHRKSGVCTPSQRGANRSEGTSRAAMGGSTPNPNNDKPRIAVARDGAFCFYYEDNFDWLRAAGAEVVFFSPLRDSALPERAAGLYLGGGYPELYAAQLADNRAMQQTIREAIQAGMPTFAECGGLMFLTGSITDLDENAHPMIGVVPGRARMRGRLTMGYRQVTAARDTILLSEGEQTRGHEFHYSDWVDRPDDLPSAYAISPRATEAVRMEGYAKDNVLASYVHLHFGANPDLAVNFVRACQEWLK